MTIDEVVQEIEKVRVAAAEEEDLYKPLKGGYADPDQRRVFAAMDRSIKRSVQVRRIVQASDLPLREIYDACSEYGNVPMLTAAYPVECMEFIESK